MTLPCKLENLNDLKALYHSQYEGWVEASKGCSGKNAQEKQLHVDHIQGYARAFKKREEQLDNLTRDSAVELMKFHQAEYTNCVKGTSYGYGPMADVHFRALMVIAKEMMKWEKSVSTAEQPKN